jgi:hypothetical protein
MSMTRPPSTPRDGATMIKMARGLAPCPHCHNPRPALVIGGDYVRGHCHICGLWGPVEFVFRHGETLYYQDYPYFDEGTWRACEEAARQAWNAQHDR